MDIEEDGKKKEKALNCTEFSIEESSAAIRQAYFTTPEFYKRDYSDKFGVWDAFFRESMNVCLYGIGSKTYVVEQYLKNHQTDHLQIRIKGSHTSVKIDNIFMKMLQTLEPFANSDHKRDVAALLGMKKHQNDMTINLLNELLKSLDEFGLTLLIIFLDIDGKNFREVETHKLMSQVFKHPAVKLLATFSNMNFVYLLNQDVLQNYNFCYLPVHTFEPNEAEMVADEMVWFNTKQSKGTDSIKAIYGALTENQREILRLLAQHISSSPNHQVTFDQLYDLCLDEMIIHDEMQLVECLREPIAHNVGKTHADRVGEVRRRRDQNPQDAKRF